MEYKTLNELPYWIYLKVLENPEENIQLLSPSKPESKETLLNHWDKLKSDFDKDVKKLMSEGFPLRRFKIELSYLRTKYITIDLAIKSLEFDYNQTLIDMLSDLDIEVSKENLTEDLKKFKEANDCRIELINFLPENVSEFDCLEWNCFWCIITDKLAPFESRSVTEVFNLQREAISIVTSINH